MEQKIAKILVFLYQGLRYIPLIEEEFHAQKVSNCEVHLQYILTDTGDGSKEKLDALHADYVIVKPEAFSHSLTRQKYILESGADYCILMTQDARAKRTDVYQSLIDAMTDDVKFAYLRQINSNHTIERYTRRFNYPKESKIKTKEDIPELGLNTFFASDACSIVNVTYFKSIGGYGRNLPTNEDMWLAYRIIQSGKAVAYVATSYVDHSHKFTLKQLGKRYYLVGQFLGMTPELDAYSANGSGLKLAFKVLGRILLEFNLPALFMFIPNMWTRYRSKRAGFASVRKGDKHE